MTAEIHTCSYYCERPGCIRAQRDELRDRMESVLASAPSSAPVGVEELAERAAQLYEAATSAGATHEQALHEAIERALSQQPAAVDEAMVERACRHWYTQWDEADRASKRLWAKTMSDLLTAALAAQQQGGRDHG